MSNEFTDHLRMLKHSGQLQQGGTFNITADKFIPFLPDELARLFNDTLEDDLIPMLQDQEDDENEDAVISQIEALLGEYNFEAPWISGVSYYDGEFLLQFSDHYSS